MANTDHNPDLGPLSRITADMLAELRELVAAGAGHDCDELLTESGVCALCDRGNPRR